MILLSRAVPASAAAGNCDSLAVDSSSTIHLSSVPAGATVIVDSTAAGVTPASITNIAPGTHVLRYLHPDRNSWFHPAIVDTLSVKAGEHIERTVQFPHFYNITS
jgi:hypothetical protein